MGARAIQMGHWLYRLPEVRREWLDVLACTEPADRDEAEAGIALAYASVGLKPPRAVVWVPDPALGAVVAAVLPGPVSGRVWADARREARYEASRTYPSRAWRRVSEQVRFPGGDRVDPAIRSACLGLAFASRNDKLPEIDDAVPQPMRLEERRVIEASMAAWGRHEFWSDRLFGYHRRGVRIALEAMEGSRVGTLAERGSRLPRHSRVRQVLDWPRNQRDCLQELARLDALSRLRTPGAIRAVQGLVTVARSAGWWWPFRDVAVVCERPSIRSLDREGRLHAENGPALAYPDGLSAYFWHGRIVPRWVVREPTVARIAAEPNVEVRRCAIEALGWPRFTREAGLKLIDECADPGNAGQRLALHSVPGKLWGSATNVLVCTNGSPDLDGGRHTFGLLVPATVRTALGAAAWGYGLTAEEYAGLQRRA